MEIGSLVAIRPESRKRLRGTLSDRPIGYIADIYGDDRVFVVWLKKKKRRKLDSSVTKRVPKKLDYFLTSAQGKIYVSGYFSLTLNDIVELKGADLRNVEAAMCDTSHHNMMYHRNEAKV